VPGGFWRRRALGDVSARVDRRNDIDVVGVARFPELAWVNEILWGGPVEVTDERCEGLQGGDVLAEFVALPSGRRPHLLIPADSRAAARSALRTYMDARRTVRVGAAGLALYLRIGALPVVGQRVRVSAAAGRARESGREPILVEYLREVFERTDLEIAIRMGGRRPNRKPVLQILTRSGELLAYVKVGWNDVTRSLVANEVAVLRRFAAGAEPTAFTFPTVLHAGTCGELEVLVMAPVLPVSWLRRVGTEAELAEVARQIAALTPETREPFGASVYWQETLARLQALHDSVRPSRFEVLADLATRLEDEYGKSEIGFGEWHGDWTRWNMGRRDSRIVVFDWERSGRRVPVGLDAAHFDFDLAVKFHRRAPLYAVRTLLEGGGTMLPHFSSPTVSPRLLLSLDLLEMVLRYEEARSAGLDVPDTLYFGAFRSAVLSPADP
jgi:hypothetical protein